MAAYGYGENVPPVPVRLTSVKGDKNGTSQDGKKKRWFKGGGSSNPGELYPVKQYIPSVSQTCMYTYVHLDLCCRRKASLYVTCV